MTAVARTLGRDTFLPFTLHGIGEEEINEVVDTLRSNWITTGPKVKRFEEEFAAFVHAPAALAVNSCTAALHLALVALGVGPGDRVATSPLTFCSSVHVIERVGAHPVLVDVEADTLNIAPDQLEAAVAKAARSVGRGGRNRVRPDGGGPIKAILPVHLYGHPCHLDPIFAIARDFDLAIIEDAAHALGATYKGRPIGSWAPGEGSTAVPNPTVMTCFSFYATKNLTTAEGGMLTGSPEFVERARIWSLHGMSRDAWKRYSAPGSWYYEVLQPGFKYNMTDIQASIGLHQLRKLPGFRSRRQEIARKYDEAFLRYEELQIPPAHSDVEHAWHLYVLRLHTERFRFPGRDASPESVRKHFIEQLTARNIGTSVHFIPIHLHPYYRNKYGYEPGDFPRAFQAYRRMLSLPLYPRMSDADVDDVIAAVTDIVHRYRL